MPHPRFKDENYENFGGVNVKASAYLTGPREVINLYNYDFSVMGAWTKRPGSTQYIGQTFSNMTGIHEYIQIGGFSQLMVGVTGGMWAGSSTGQLVGISMSDLGTTQLARGYINFVSFNAGWEPYQSDTFEWVRLPTRFGGGDVDFVNYLNNAYMASGSNYLRYNGASVFLPNIPPAFGVSQLSSLFGASSALGSSLYLTAAFYNFYAQLVNSNGEAGPVGHLGQFSIDINGATLSSYWGSFPIIRSSIYTPQEYGLSAINLFVSTSGVTTARGITALGLDIRYLRTVPASASQVTVVDFGLNPNQIVAGGVAALPVAEDLNNEYLYYGIANQSVLAGGIYGQIEQGFTLSPRFLEIYNDRLALVGFSGLPSSFLITEVASPASVLPDNVFEVRTNDGDILTGAKFFLNQLILFKQKSFHSFTGDAPENFYLKQLSNEYGCLNNKAICVWQDKLWFLDQSGIVEFNGANIQEVSNKVQPKFTAMNVDAAKTQAIMLHQKERNEIWCAIPVNGATLNNLTIIYDYDSNAWGYWDGFNPKYFANIKQRFNQSTGFFADYSGRVNNFSASYMADNGAGISTVVQTRFEHPMGQSVEKMFRRLFINYESMTGETINNFNINYRKNYGESIVLTTGFTMTSFQQYNNFGIGAKSLSVEIGHYSAVEKLRIYGYTVEHRYQRNE